MLSVVDKPCDKDRKHNKQAHAIPSPRLLQPVWEFGVLRFHKQDRRGQNGEHKCNHGHMFMSSRLCKKENRKGQTGLGNKLNPS